MTQATEERKKSFSSFTYKEAFKQLGVSELQRWSISAEPVPISDFFRQRLERLQRFDLEVSKTLLIDAICEEGLEGLERLKGLCCKNLLKIENSQKRELVMQPLQKFQL